MSNQDQNRLEQDAVLDQPLKRVSYEAGMLLGLDATREEQEYHRRRLTRHQYWFQGAGTVAGMVVKMDPDEAADNDPVALKLIVTPGIGIDGLGREILIHEPYCVDLGQWLKTRTQEQLMNGYDEAPDPNILHLTVYARQMDCSVAMQPVLARKLNLSTDPVAPSRTADSLALDIEPELPNSDSFKPWAQHSHWPDDLTDQLPSLNPTEQNLLDTSTGEQQKQLQLKARLLHALDQDGVSPPALELLQAARIPLARVSIEVNDLSVYTDATETEAVLNPNAIEINNLIRPFVFTPSQLAYLSRQP